MKFSPNDIKKIAANAIFLLLLVWLFFTNYRTPTLEKIERATKEAAELRVQVGAAQEQISRTRALSEKADSAEEIFAYFFQFMREGEPIAWFPPQIEAFFDRHGIKGVSTKLGTTASAPEPELSQFSLLSWTIELPRVAFVPLGIAVAALENENPTLEIRSLRIEVPRDNPELQQVLIGAATLLKPRE
jgi:hypothetical protein